MAVNTPVEPGSPDSYWVATRQELASVKRRGDLLIVGGAGVLLALLAALPDTIHDRRSMQIGALLMLALIVGVVWFVSTRKRRIAATRGLVCGRCHYLPHDTEIDDVASNRHCPRCAAEL
jgi:hypothetical protein